MRADAIPGASAALNDIYDPFSYRLETIKWQIALFSNFITQKRFSILLPHLPHANITH